MDPVAIPSARLEDSLYRARYSSEMTIDERIEALTARHEALTMNVKLIGRDIEKLLQNSTRDSENIRALARIAETHEHRPTDFEGGMAQ